MLLTGVGGAEAQPVRSITEIATAPDRLSERLGFIPSSSGLFLGFRSDPSFATRLI